MATSKDRILEYLNKKNDFILEKIEMKLFIDADFKEISNNWTDDECTKIWLFMTDFAITDNKKDLNKKLSRWLCPWCLKNLDKCEDCDWGERHGFCGINNDWSEARRRLDIVKIDYMTEFRNIIKKIHMKIQSERMKNVDTEYLITLLSKLQNKILSSEKEYLPMKQFIIDCVKYEINRRTPLNVDK